MKPRWIDAAVIVYATTVSAAGSALVARRMFPPDTPFARLLLWQGVPYVAWAAMVPLLDWLVRKRRLSLLAIGSFAAVAAHAAFSAWWLSFAHPTRSARTFADRFWERAGIALLIYIAIVALLWLREESRRRARLEADLVRAELEILKLQLQPHFLFNTLQSIAVLVKKDPDAAVTMTRDLASLLRVALRRGGQTTTLGAELELVRHYLAIEQVRFGDRLRIVWDVDAAAESCVVPELMLQPIVENAVRHGATQNQDGGTVTIRARREQRLIVEVIDDGPPFADFEERIGLGATRSRLQNLYGDDHLFAIEGKTVRIEVPQ
ncbi:MAG TPA: histidine kinase [Thermoanaerobaculia bacterium]|nr:histidine kinase [Thermoanaerobaculia bacterium]